jgi:hypothetical protein
MTSRMVGSVLTFVILLFSVVGGAAQTYTQMQWGMNKGATPYAFGANINGTWRDLGTVSSAGAWQIPYANISDQPVTAVVSPNTWIDLYLFNKAGAGTRQQQIGLNRDVQCAGGFFSIGVCNISGYQGFISFTHTKDILSAQPSASGGFGTTAGGYFVARNDITSSSVIQPGAYGIYTEASADLPGLFSAGIEVDCENINVAAGGSNPTPNTLYNNPAGTVNCFGVWVSNGGTILPDNPTDSSSAITVVKAGGPGKWHKGLLFAADAIKSNGGNMEAINLGQNHQIVWYGATDADKTRLYSDGTTTTMTASGTDLLVTTNGVGINAPGAIGYQGVSKAVVVNGTSSSGVGTAVNGTGGLGIQSGGGFSLLNDPRAGSYIGLTVGGSVIQQKVEETRITFNTGIVSAGTSPTATGAGGTCAAGTVAGGALVGTVALTGVCAATNTLALTSMPAAATGYVCDAADRSTGVLNLVQTATTTTSATFTFNASTGATDVIQFKCLGY